MDGASFDGSVYSQVNGLHFNENRLNVSEAEDPSLIDGELENSHDSADGESPVHMVAGQPSLDSSKSPVRFPKKVRVRSCNICKKRFVHLKQHMKTHSMDRERSFKCSHCDRTFLSKPGLKYHEETHSTEKPFKCDKCNQEFYSQKSLNTHAKKHSSESFLCNFCGKVLKNSNSLKIHLRTHTGQKPYKCKFCSKAFAYSNVLRDHLSIHTGRRPYPCSICGRAFRQRSAMKSHVRFVHNNFKRFRCGKCSSAFSSEKYLHSHVKTVHVERVKPFGPCLECGKYFPQRYLFVKHVAMHANPRKCQVCKRNFSKDEFLQRHLKIHGMFKPIKCGHCGLMFHNRAKAEKHVRDHVKSKIAEDGSTKKGTYQGNSITIDLNGLRPFNQSIKSFKCGHCGATFDSQKQSLSHMMQHIGKLTGSAAFNLLPHRMQISRQQDKIPNAFKCGHCGVFFESHKDALDHVEQHSISCQQQADITKPPQLSAADKLPGDANNSVREFLGSKGNDNNTTPNLSEGEDSEEPNSGKITVVIEANGYEESDTDEDSSLGGWLESTRSQYEQRTSDLIAFDFEPGVEPNLNANISSHADGANYPDSISGQDTATDFTVLSGRQHENIEKPCNVSTKSISSHPASTVNNSVASMDESQPKHPSLPPVEDDKLELNVKENTNTYSLKMSEEENETAHPEVTNEVLQLSNACDSEVKDSLEAADTSDTETNMVTNPEEQAQVDESIVSCDLCGKMVKKNTLCRHKRHIHHAKIPCGVCGRMFGTEYLLEKHMISHSEVKAFQCEYCAKTFKWEKALKVHTRTHTNERPYGCRYCDKKFAHTNVRKDHERTHTGERPFVCEVCGVGFKQRSSLNSHKHMHDDTKQFKCDECGQSCARKITLMKHMEIHNKNRQKYQCDVCGVSVTSAGGLAKHKLLHGKYSCTRCPRRFRTEKAKDEHIKKYKGMKLHACGMCDKVYHSRAVLRRHMVKHTGHIERKYKCEICKVPFTKEKLEEHRLSYSGRKPFFCGHCHQRFHERDQAMEHILSHVKEGTNTKPHYQTLKAITPMSSGIIETQENRQFFFPA